ncbi:hypothetical protein BDW75DRAFT_244141 [Aspergillus navahoensis]
MHQLERRAIFPKRRMLLTHSNRFTRTVDQEDRMRMFDYACDRTFDHSWETDVHSSWKLQIENYNECYRCATSHPLISGITDLPKYRLNRTGMRGIWSIIL